MCAVWDSGLHGKGQRVKAPSECSKWVVNSVSLSRDLPVFPGFFEIIRVFIHKDTNGSTTTANISVYADDVLVYQSGDINAASTKIPPFKIPVDVNR